MRKPPRQTSRAVPSPIPGNAIYQVRSGETLYGISFRFGLRFQDVAAWNGIVDPYVIHVGQRLRLRSSSAVVSTGTSPRYPTAGVTTPTVTSANPPRANSVAPALPPPVRHSEGSVVPGTAAVIAPSTPVLAEHAVSPTGFSSMTWNWPASGQIIGRYVQGDQTQQGINIAGTSGQNVTAAADGTVVYSGAGLVGYGELIIIKHSDEWLSAYAHNRRRLVAEGARVKGGDSIAEMGRTGAIRDMLHFEIRRNGKPVDPLQLLPKP